MLYLFRDHMRSICDISAKLQRMIPPPIMSFRQYRKEIVSICSLSFSSEIMANDLVVYGVRTRKWFVAKVKGGIESDRDTWHGAIDGDGHLGIYKRRKNNGTIRLVPYISLTGNLYVCHQFKAFLEHRIGMLMPNVISYKRSYFFSVSDHRAVRAIKLLYEDCAVALERKLEVAKRIMDSFRVQGTSRYLARLGEPTGPTEKKTRKKK